MSVKKPRIGISLGDVAGVGPEVAVKALLDPAVASRCIPIVIGELSVVRHYAERLAPERRLRTIDRPADANSETTDLQILDLKNIEFSKVRLGEVDVACGRAALDYIRAGVNLCLNRELDALVTGPIHKEAAQLAGINAPGHTEYLAAFCGVPEVRMLLVVDHLRAMHISTHLSLRKALDCVTKERILETIHYGVGALKQLRIENGTNRCGRAESPRRGRWVVWSARKSKKSRQLSRRHAPKGWQFQVRCLQTRSSTA